MNGYTRCILALVRDETLLALTQALPGRAVWRGPTVLRLRGVDALRAELLRQTNAAALVDSSAGIDVTQLEPLIDLLVKATESGRLSRIAVYSRPRTSDLRLVQAIARRTLCSLILEGVDEPKAFLAALGLGDPGEACDQHDVDSFGALRRLPDRLRVVTLEALASRPKPNVKTLALQAGVSRRTIERLFKAAGLPGPAALLRQDFDDDQPMKNPERQEA